MATGIKNAAGTDTDSLFYSGNAAITTGFKRADGTDLGSIYAAYTTGTKVSATGLKNSAGTDFADLFQNAAVPPVTEHSVSKSGDSFGQATTITSGGSVNVFGSAVTVSVSNGVGPFTYSWGFVTGDSANVTSSTSATTTFSRNAAAPTVLGQYNEYVCTYRCTVTDTGNGNLTKTVDVTVTTHHYYDT